MAATERTSTNVIVGMISTAETIAIAGTSAAPDMPAILKNLGDPSDKRKPAVQAGRQQWC